MDKLYRIVDCDGRPVKTGQPRRERTYLKQSTAQSIATALTEYCRDSIEGQVVWLGPAPYRVEVTETDWRPA